MVRVKRGNVANKRRKKIMRHTKGFKSSNSRLYKIAHQQYLKSLNNSYKGRKQKKRFFRRVWIRRINSVIRQNHLSYSRFISLLKVHRIALNRKILSIFSLSFPKFFEKLD